MPHSLARQHLRLDRWSTANPDRLPGDIAAEWEAHLDAGRIRNHQTARPAVVANRDRTAALFDRIVEEARRGPR